MRTKFWFVSLSCEYVTGCHLTTIKSLYVPLYIAQELLFRPLCYSGTPSSKGSELPKVVFEVGNLGLFRSDLSSLGAA